MAMDSQTSKLSTAVFPKIEHINDVLPHIENRSDIIVIDKGNYKVIDYVYNEPDTFDNVYRRECRGLKFDSDGKIIARPFHKFFNLEERDETKAINLDFGKPHRILDKLDGTMVHGCLLDGRLVLMTRKGITEHAERAYEFLDKYQKIFLKKICKLGYTPILEYVGPENQIVLFYEQPRLVWLSVRNNITGEYTDVTDKNPFKRPDEIGFPLTPAKIQSIRDWKDIEGFVVVWDDGTRVKIKADEYVEKHRIATGPFLEIHYLHAILDDLIDDILPLKHGEFRERLDKYVSEVRKRVNEYSNTLISFVGNAMDIDQKTFAVHYVNGLDQPIKNMCFELRSKGGNTHEIVVKHLKRLFKTQRDLDEHRRFIGAKLDV